MPDTGTLIRSTQELLAPVEARLLDHPYLRLVEAGKLDRSQLATFAVQQRYIIPSDLRSIGMLVNRFGSGPTGQFFIDSIATEQAALEVLPAFEGAVGVAAGELPLDRVLPGSVAYCHYLAWLSLYGSDAEFAAAFLLNLRAWGTNCGRMAEALRSVYGMSEEDVAFFRLFAADSPSFERAATSVITAGLDRGVDPDRITLAARLLQSYELLYWDSLYEVSHG